MASHRNRLDVGHLIAAPASLEVLDDTLVYVLTGDNRVVAEGTPQGTVGAAVDGSATCSRTRGVGHSGR